MSQLAKNFTAEHVSELNVDTEYQHNTRLLEQTFKEMSALPQNPYATTTTLNDLKDRMGVEENKNDFSMFMAGAASAMATGMLMGAAGLTGAFATAAELGAAMATERVAERANEQKTTFKRAPDATNANKQSIFAAPKPANTAKRAPKQVMQTSFMRRAMQKRAKEQQFRAYLAVRHKHRAYEADLRQIEQNFSQLNNHKAKGISSISQTENGKAFNASANPHQQKLVSERDQQRNDTANRLVAAGYSRRQVMPALRMGM